ncbi:MAG: cytochrome P450 [Myxococcota bacterium]|jgi:cytochrome P450
MTAGSKAPGPRGDTLLGSTLDFKDKPLDFISYIHHAYGDVARFRVGPMHWYLMAHPEDIWEAMVRKPDIFVKPNIAKRLWEKFLGNGLLTLEGAEWKRMHSLVRPAFHRHRIEAYAETMVSYSHRLVDAMEPGSQIDFDDAMVSLTLEIVAKTLFDADVRDGTTQVGEAMHVLNVEMLNHIHMPIPVPRWWPSTRNRRKMRAIDNIEEIVRAVIEERRAEGTDRGDLLSTLILSRDDEGVGMTDKEVRDQAMTMFFAGHETTAHAMTWAWFLLARHPLVTARLQADIDAVTRGERLSIAHLKELPYLDQVIKEAMRILPSVWVFIKQPTEDVVVRGFRIPKGSPVMISPYVTHHDARWFPSPETFDPDRFSPERAGDIPNGAYIPFSGGQRVCIGRNFAMMEAKLVLGSLLQRLVPSVPADFMPVKQAVLSMQPLGGLPTNVTFRRPLLEAASK